MRSQRLLLPDLLRSLALAVMIVFHAVYDLNAYHGWSVDLRSGTWLVLGRGAATLFLLLAGVSTALSLSRTSKPWRRTLLRVFRIGLGAVAVSIVTYVIDPDTYVRFGILHLIAVSILVLPLFRRIPVAAIAIGAVVLLLGLFVRTVDTQLLLPLGFHAAGFTSVDYYPLIPWSGIVLLGYGFGAIGQPWLQRTPSVEESPQVVQLLAWPGKHSLLIYLFHQPVIAGLLWILLP